MKKISALLNCLLPFTLLLGVGACTPKTQTPSDGYTLRDPKLSVTADGAFSAACILPSGGDNSYPGFLRVGDELWTVYYSSHELVGEDGKPRAAIYLARLPLSFFR